MFEGATRFAAKVALKAKKYSPQILIGGGIIFVGTGVVLACRATLKVQDKMEEGKKSIDEIKMNHITKKEDEYPEKEYKKDLTKQYAENVITVVTEYAPAAGCLALGVTCFVGAWRIEHTRYICTVAAYNTLQDTFLRYRKRVVDDQGKEKDKEYLHGIKSKQVTVENEDGSVTTVMEAPTVDDISPYARFFDSGSVAWTKNPEMNLHYCLTQQNAANDLLRLHGHVFLNEVYDMLGIPRSQAGAVVGWVLGNGDDYIDFGIYDSYNERKRDFVNGYENVILLDFNVDGVIYDKI